MAEPSSRRPVALVAAIVVVLLAVVGVVLVATGHPGPGAGLLALVALVAGAGVLAVRSGP